MSQLINGTICFLQISFCTLKRAFHILLYRWTHHLLADHLCLTLFSFIRIYVHKFAADTSRVRLYPFSKNLNNFQYIVVYICRRHPVRQQYGLLSLKDVFLIYFHHRSTFQIVVVSHVQQPIMYLLLPINKIYSKCWTISF